MLSCFNPLSKAESALSAFTQNEIAPIGGPVACMTPKAIQKAAPSGTAFIQS
jgi:hypothetical protein